jgi:hypothetical protein
MQEVLPCRLAASTALAPDAWRAGLCHTSTVVLPRQADDELACRPRARIVRIDHGPRRIPMSTFTVGYMVGSLAKGSIDRKLAMALARLAPSDYPVLPRNT